MIENKEMTLFDCLQRLGEAHKDTGALPGPDFEAFYECVREDGDFIRDRLRLSEFQAILFADVVLFFSTNPYNRSFEMLARHIGCTCIRLFNFIPDFEVLEEKGLISMDLKHNEICPCLDTLRNFDNGTFDAVAQYIFHSTEDFFVEIAKFCERCIQRKWTYRRTIKVLQDLLENNPNLKIVKILKSYGLSVDDMFILLRFCHYTVNLEEPDLSFHHLEAVYKDTSDFLPVKQKLIEKKHPLQKLDLIDYSFSDGMAKADTFCLTDKAENELLFDFKEQLAHKNVQSLLNPESITCKDLFYPAKTAARIDELRKILSKDNFSCLQERLRQEGMRTGFPCLFSGGPGTGKTETALQLARQTGRAIMQVDIADTKSPWFGDSERRIKEVFSSYRAVCKRSPDVPILLFNEADAVIGKRRLLNEAHSGTGQTENAIQNIILEQLENLEGILIATTNLSQNMDKAFERRFLYKIEFEKPTPVTRKAIWQSHIKDLQMSDTEILASRFDFSGGQIENIARKRSIARIVYGVEPSLEKTIEYCNDEISGETTEKPIGFSIFS